MLNFPFAHRSVRNLRTAACCLQCLNFTGRLGKIAQERIPSIGAGSRSCDQVILDKYVCLI